MTVGELIKVSPWCELIEVVIRVNGCGKWIYGYRIGKDVKIYPSEVSAEVKELRSLKEYTPYGNKRIVKPHDGDVYEIGKEFAGTMKIKVICVDIRRRLPKEVADLEVYEVKPGKVRMESKIGDWNSWEHTYYIDCLPPDPGQMDRILKETTRQQAIEEDGQMCLEDFMNQGRGEKDGTAQTIISV